MASNAAPNERWDSGNAYDLWVGRWSRKVAPDFIDWLAVPWGASWGDVGCGTGALADCILRTADPDSVLAIDRSDAYVAEARRRVGDVRARFAVADACALAWRSHACDATVSGLVLNFVADPAAMAAEMARVTKPGGVVAAYVWDYAGGMQMLRTFWDVALELNPGDAGLDQAERFPVCKPGPLEELLRRAGLSSVLSRAIEVPTVFRDFEDYWTPFLGRQGAAPAYLASLSQADQDRIRDALKARVLTAADGSIAMTARAWAVKGTR
jgi:SAM-dependent methyltransferase